MKGRAGGSRSLWTKGAGEVRGSGVSGGMTWDTSACGVRYSDDGSLGLGSSVAASAQRQRRRRQHHCTARHFRRRRHSGVASEMCQAGTNQQPMGMSALTRDAGAPWNKAVVCGPIEATNAAAQHGGSARRLLGSVGQRVRQGGPGATGQGRRARDC
jgi:hypothetical protein